MDAAPLNIFEYDDYRKFLQAAFAQRQRKDPKFSHRQFSKLAGLRTSSFLTHIIDGDRNLSRETIDKIGKALELNRDELSYFRNLVLLNQSQDYEERQYFAERILRSRGYNRARPMALPQHQYFTQWYFVAIRELVGLKTFKEDPEWIASSLSGLITPAQAVQSLKELEKLELIKRDENGKLIQTQTHLSATDEIGSAFISSFHKEMIRMGSESIGRFESSLREISSATVAISKKRFKEAKRNRQRLSKAICRNNR